MHFMRRAVPVGLLALSLLMPAASAAAQVTPDAPGGTGTVVGSVACGINEDSAVSNTLVAVDGRPSLSVESDADGRFALSGVPARQGFTIEALSGTTTDAAPLAARADVTVQPGETLDIGPLDLSVCPVVAPLETPDTTAAQMDGDQ
jgi:hypothetical protein